MPMLTHKASHSDPTLLVMGDDACYKGSPGRGSQLTVRFRVTVDFTQPGDTVTVVGSVQELGGWDSRRGLVLSTSPETFPVWEGKMALHFSETEVATFRYKHVVLTSKGSCVWESTSDRVPILALPPKARAKPTKEEWVLAVGWQGPEAIPHCLGYKYPATPPLTLPLQKGLCGTTTMAAASGSAAPSSAGVPCQPMEQVDGSKKKDFVKENEEKEEEKETISNPGHQGKKQPKKLTMVPGARHIMQEMESTWEELKVDWRQYISSMDKLAAAEATLSRTIGNTSPLDPSPTSPSSPASKTGGCCSALGALSSTGAPVADLGIQRRLRGCASPSRRRQHTRQGVSSAQHAFAELKAVRRQQMEGVLSMRRKLNAAAGLYQQLKGQL